MFNILLIINLDFTKIILTEISLLKRLSPPGPIWLAMTRCDKCHAVPVYKWGLPLTYLYTNSYTKIKAWKSSQPAGNPLSK